MEQNRNMPHLLNSSVACVIPASSYVGYVAQEDSVTGGEEGGGVGRQAREEDDYGN